MNNTWLYFDIYDDKKDNMSQQNNTNKNMSWWLSIWWNNKNIKTESFMNVNDPKFKKDTVVKTEPVKTNNKDAYVNLASKYVTDWWFVNLISAYDKASQANTKWTWDLKQWENYVKYKKELEDVIYKEVNAKLKKIVDKEIRLVGLINNPNISESQKQSYKKEIDNIKKAKSDISNDLKTIWYKAPNKDTTTTTTNTTKVEDKKTNEVKVEDKVTTTDTVPTTTTTSSTTKPTTTTSTNTSTGTTFPSRLQSKWLTEEETNKDSRAKIAASMWIQWYEWTKEQNMKMEEFLKDKTAEEYRALLSWTKTASEDKKEWDASFGSWDFLDESITGKKWATSDSTYESDISEEINIEDLYRGENVYEEALNKTLDEYANKLNATEEEKAKIRDAAAAKEKEILEDTNLDARQRSEKRKEALDEIAWEYNASVQQRREELKANTERTKWIAERQSRIWAALAWQSWQWLTAWAVNSIQNDILSQYDSNISKAELEEIRNNSELDTALRESWMETFRTQDWIDKFLDWLDVAENAPLINALKETALWNIKAKDDVMNFIKTLTEERATSQFWRSESIERTSEDIEAYPKLSPDQKVAFMIDKIKNVEWSQFISDWVRNMILKYPNMSYPEIKVKLEKEAAYANQRNIISNTVFQKNYDDMSADEKKIISDVVDRWWAALDRWDASVERTDKEVAEIDKQQTEFEQWKIDEAKRKLEEEKKKADEDKKKEEAKKIEEDKKSKWFKWFKSEAAYNNYQKWVENFKLVKEQLDKNKDPALAERVKQAALDLKKYKEKYSI